MLQVAYCRDVVEVVCGQYGRVGRGVFIEENYDNDLYGATSFVSILSLPTVLDQLVPKLAAAVDGNPATS